MKVAQLLSVIKINPRFNECLLKPHLRSSHLYCMKFITLPFIHLYYMLLKRLNILVMKSVS